MMHDDYESCPVCGWGYKFCNCHSSTSDNQCPDFIGYCASVKDTVLSTQVILLDPMVFAVLHNPNDQKTVSELLDIMK